MVKLEIEITFNLRSPYHSTGDRIELGLDRLLALDPMDQKTPIVPATSYKGVLRMAIERVLHPRGKSCLAPRPTEMDNQCIVCQIFGSPKQRSKLQFHDAKFTDSQRGYRIGVGINRRRRTAQEDYLFSTETGYGNTFTEMVEGFFHDSEEALLAAALIYLGARSLFAVGGNKSRGLGWIEIKEGLYKAKVNGVEITSEKISRKLEELI